MRLEAFSINDLGEFTPKLQLAKLLCVSTRTLYEYHDIAMLISDFEADYPAVTFDSLPYTRAGLTKYQCWVLFALILCCRRLSREAVKHCIQQDSNLSFTAKFTKKYYQENQGEFTSEKQGICKVA